MSVAYQAPSYPVVRFLLRFERFAGLVVGLSVVLGALLWTWPQISPAFLVTVVGAGVFAGLLIQSYVEILRIISDTLLPR